MITVNRSKDIQMKNLQIGLMQRASKMSDIDFIDLFFQYNSNRHLTLDDFAEKVGVRRSMIHKYFTKIDEEELFLKY